MNRIVFQTIIIMGIVFMVTPSSNANADTREIRTSGVAGSFYESDPTKLEKTIRSFLSGAKALPEPVRFLISPHAGYLFSGPVAARGYAALGKNSKRVFIIGPSHYHAFSGIALPKFRFYETPLGKVPVDRTTVDILTSNKNVVVAEGFDEPEHCIEVQLPFLQVILKEFSIVPIITGKCSPEEIGSMLLPFIDATTAVIISTDLSHYKNQTVARKTDSLTVSTILSGNRHGSIDACGETPLRIMMHLAKQKGLTAVEIDSRTSFDTAPLHCPENRVVGYASIAFLSPEAAKKYTQSIDPGYKAKDHDFPNKDKKVLLQLARKSLEAAVKGDTLEVPSAIPQILKEKSGCFVTLTIQGTLRGCIGYIEPIQPLYKAVIDNAENAALKDPRFSPVTEKELSEISIEVSVLTRPEQLTYKSPSDLLDKLSPNRDGVILSDGIHQSTYLPQVWEQLPDKVLFLEQLSIKGGMPRDGWKTAMVKTYRAIHFSE